MALSEYGRGGRGWRSRTAQDGRQGRGFRPYSLVSKGLGEPAKAQAGYGEQSSKREFKK